MHGPPDAPADFGPIKGLNLPCEGCPGPIPNNETLPKIQCSSAISNASHANSPRA